MEPPHRLVFKDGFADDAGEPNDDLEQVLAMGMGMEESIRAAVQQIDAPLAEG